MAPCFLDNSYTYGPLKVRQQSLAANLQVGRLAEQLSERHTVYGE